jgi:hypothetical protein
MKHGLIALTLIALASCNQNSESSLTSAEKKSVLPSLPEGKIFEYGIYRAQRKGRVRNDLSTNTGKIISKPVLTLSQQTRKIPLLKDTFFAYRYRLLNLPRDEVKKPTVELRKVLIHPPMTLPDGSISTGWDRIFRGRTSIGQVIAFDGYAFNEDYELVEGDWIFQIWFRDKKLTEQIFTTYNPQHHPADLTSASIKDTNGL